MKVLFVHQNFPGQYKHLAPALVERGHKVVAIGMHKNPVIEGVETLLYNNKRGTTQNIHPWVIDYESKVIRAEACANACQQLKNRGFEPDIICAHPGWGEALLLREVWPVAKQLHFIEFFYGPKGKDVGFDPEFPVPDFSGRCRLHIKNTNNLMNLHGMDWGLSPTHWQRSTVPEKFQERISVIHDGVDTKKLVPNTRAVLKTRDDRGREIEFSRVDKVVTFINRNLEPNRGYHIFMRVLPALLKEDKEVRVVIIGGDGVSYGAKPDAGSWKEKYRNEVSERIDDSRVHFIGKVPYEIYCAAMQVSRAHVYLTYPFVLSWSMLEAMSMGAAVIGSRTAPVEEVIEHGVNGWLVDFFDTEEIKNQILDVLNTDTSEVCEAARKYVQKHYDLRSVCLPQHLALLEKLASSTSA